MIDGKSDLVAIAARGSLPAPRFCSLMQKEKSGFSCFHIRSLVSPRITHGTDKQQPKTYKTLHFLLHISDRFPKQPNANPNAKSTQTQPKQPTFPQTHAPQAYKPKQRANHKPSITYSLSFVSSRCAENNRPTKGNLRKGLAGGLPDHGLLTAKTIIAIQHVTFAMKRIVREKRKLCLAFRITMSGQSL